MACPRERVMKRLIVVAILVALVMPLFGCLTFDRSHDEMHWRAIQQDVDKFHKSVDRYFFDIDETDPDRY